MTRKRVREACELTDWNQRVTPTPRRAVVAEGRTFSFATQPATGSWMSAQHSGRDELLLVRLCGIRQGDASARSSLCTPKNGWAGAHPYRPALLPCQLL